VNTAAEGEEVLRFFWEELRVVDPQRKEVSVERAWVHGRTSVIVLYRYLGSGRIGYFRDFADCTHEGARSIGAALARDIDEPVGNARIDVDPVTGISWVGLAGRRFPPVPEN
jgi:hypothetical protein